MAAFKEDRYKSVGNAIEALQKISAPKSLLRRDGVVKEIDSGNVVPGDILVLDTGRFIAADLRLFESANLQVEESALTGESLPADKDAQALPPDPQTPIGKLEASQAAPI